MVVERTVRKITRRGFHCILGDPMVSIRLDCGHRLMLSQADLDEAEDLPALGETWPCDRCGVELAAEREQIVADLPGAD